MNIDNLVAVSGMPGIFEMVANKSNGLVLMDFSTGKKRFVTSRKHQFTPLQSISIYTLTDTVPLDEVLQKMRDKKEEVPIVKTSSPAGEVREYFSKILPEHDDTQVHISDIKKLIKWFNFMEAHNLMDRPKEVEETNDTEEVTNDAEKKSEE